MDSIDGGFWQYGDDSWPQAELIFFAGTFSKHPLTMAASKAVLEYIKAHPALYDDINQKTARLTMSLNTWFSATGTPIEIVSAGSLFRFKFNGNYDILFHHLMLRGIFIWEGRNCFVSVAHADEDIDRFIAAVKESVSAMRVDGFFGEAGLRPDTRYAAADSQQRFLQLAAQDESGLLAGTIGGVIETPRNVDSDIMRAAWQLLCERHDALRMQFTDAGELQVALAPTVDVCEEYAAPAACLADFAARPFDLTAAPLARLLLVRHEGKTTLAISAHHSVADGWSFMVMLRELLHLYDALASGKRPELAAAASYLQAIRTQNIVSEAELSARIAALPVRRATPDALTVLAPSRTYQGQRLVQRLSYPGLTGQLRKASAELRVTRFAMLNALFTLTLEMAFGHAPVPVGVPDAGRDFGHGDALVGQCVRLLPLCIDSAVCASVSGVARAIHDGILAQRGEPAMPSRCFHGQDAPLPLLATFNVEPHTPLAEMRQWEASLSLLPIGAVEFPLMVNILETKEGLSVELDYQMRYFTEERARALLAHFLKAITVLDEQGEEAVEALFSSSEALAAS